MESYLELEEVIEIAWKVQGQYGPWSNNSKDSKIMSLAFNKFFTDFLE